MTNASEAVAEARAQLKKLAASMLARKERLEAELSGLERERVRAAEELGQLDPEGDLDADLSALSAELDAKILTTRAELAQAKVDLAATLAEMDDLAKTQGTAQRADLQAQVRAATGRDPFSRDPADVALANVREHIGNLDARVRLESELAGTREPEAPRVREDPDARARAILAEMKAKKKGTSTGGGASTDDDPPPASTPKKRTL